MKTTKKRAMGFAMGLLCVVISAASYADAASPPALTSVGVQLYQPNDELVDRLGENAAALAKYIEALQSKLAASWATSGQAGIAGVMITVGVKPNGKSRVWIDTVGGDLPRGVVSSLEAQLEQVPPLSVQKGPIALSIRFQVAGQPVPKFPDVPSAWSDASIQAGKTLEVPDGIFTAIWKD